MEPDGRVPPNDLEAEAAVLSAVFLDGSTLDTVSDFLQAAHFYSHDNGTIYAAQLALRAASKPVDAVTVKGWLADRDLLSRVGGVRYLAQIIDAVPAIANVETYARTVFDKARQREVIATARRIVVEGYGQIGDTQAWIDKCEQSVFELAAERSTHKPQRLRSIMREHYLDIQGRLQQQAAERITTGLVDLDKQIVGLASPNLIVIAGRPGLGKSSLLSHVARHVARKHGGVALFSLEMSRQELLDQMVCAEAKVDSRRMAQLDGLTEDDWNRITATANDLNKLPLWIDDEGKIGLTALRAKCRRIAAECKAAGTPLRLVGIDYLQLMGVNARAQTREQEVAQNSRELKALAKDLGVPVIVLSQLNRAPEQRKGSRPGLSDLRESGAIEQDADQVWFLFHDDHATAEVTTISVAKGRRFGTGDVRVYWQAEFTRFDDLDASSYSYAPQGKDF
ncbi:MAG: replicative DNA helicase [Deltaproteobacteria bacterium]|nr:replicative DNA helicase [Deltaproteobacteria bacterium]